MIDLLKALTIVLLLGATGCQTFDLTDEEFRRQQRGEILDRDTSDVTAAAGMAAYTGLGIYSAVRALTGH